MTDTATETTTDVPFTAVASIPVAVRKAGEGREKTKWEEKLAPLKSDKTTGHAFLTWTYDKKSAATSRVAAIRDRLFDQTPSDNWTLVVRPVPEQPGTFGVYVQYNGTFTEDEVTANAKAREERSQRIKKAKEAAAKADGAVGAEASIADASATPQTPAEKVAAAKRAAVK